MWSLYKASPFDNLSTRRIAVIFLATLVVLFSAAITITAPAQAQTASDPLPLSATWKGDNLDYNGYTVQKADPSRKIPTLTGTDCDNKENVYSTDIFPYKPEPGKSFILVICLESGATIGDKSKPVQAYAIRYLADEGTTRASAFQNDASIKITVSPLGTDAAGNSTEPKTTTSCDNTNTYGIGWIVCPITKFLAAGMDWLFEILTSFLVVAPLSTDQGVLFRAWGFMRNLANVLFVAGFLVIIYSQITSFGLSNYGIKRLLPRLVIAAVLVNVSYWIAAIGIDLSNIMGFAFQQAFEAMRNSLDVVGGSSGAPLVTWESMAGFILSGGAIAAGGGEVIASLVTTGVGASIMLLLPILVGVLVAALVAILVLAARQALITVLVILSPLACVAYLLPNTEKYFERWRELFMTMLLVFPIFSIVFGGAQLAGTAIILTAKNAAEPNVNSINLVLLGMAVQVAPVVITPLLVRLSGNLLGRIAGIVNNSNKGLIDRTRNFTNERANLARAARLGAPGADGTGFRHNGPGARLARRLDYAKRNRAGRQKAYESNVEAGFANTDAAHQIHAVSSAAHLRRETGEKEAEYLFNEAVRTSAGLQELDLRSRLNQQRAATSKTLNDSVAEQVKADPTLVANTAAGMAAIAIANEMQERTNEERNLAHRLNTEKRAQESNYNQALLGDQQPGATAAAVARAVAMREFAGDIDVDPHGATRILNLAQEAETRERETRITAARATLGREEVQVNELVNLSLGRVPATGRFASFAADDDSRSAAIRHLVKTAPEFALIEVMENLNLSSTAAPGSTEALIRSEFAAALSERKPFWVPESVRNRMAEGTLSPDYNHAPGRNRMIRETLNNFGLDPNTMVSADRDDLQAIADFFGSAEAAHLSAAARNRLIQNFGEAFDPNGLYEGKMGKRRVELNNIRNTMGLPLIP